MKRIVKKIKIFLLMILLLIPCYVNAKVLFNYEDAVINSRKNILSLEDSIIRVFQTDNYFIEKEDYDIVGGINSYLFDGQCYFTKTIDSSNNVFVIDKLNQYVSKSHICGIRNSISLSKFNSVKGNGTYQSPWEFNDIIKMVVTFDSNGGNEPNPKTKEVVYNKYYGTLPIVSRDSYTFNGWHTSIDGKNNERIITETSYVFNTNNHTLYAWWTAKEYLVKYDSNGGNGKMDDSSFVYGQTQKLSKNKFTKTGYEFVGWTTSSAGSVIYADEESVLNISEPGKAVTLYAKWKPITYSVKYNANGGSGSMANTSFTYDASGTLRTNSFTKTGYEFTGWSLTASGAVKYLNAASVKNLTTTKNGVVDLYAKWKPITYSVKYIANGGSGSMANTSFTYDASGTLRTNSFTKTGYEFTGWSLTASGAVKYLNAASVKNLTTTKNGVVNLYAKWKPITYSVKYNANGGSGSMANTTFTYDTSGTLRTNSFTKTGYEFTGWSLTASGAVKYLNAASVKNLTTTKNGVVNLYAKWKPITYSVKYNANGGSGSMANTTFTYDTSGTLRTNSFTNGSKKFAGWSLTASGAVKYLNGASVKNLTTTKNAVVNLYAKWTSPKWYCSMPESVCCYSSYVEGYNSLDQACNALCDNMARKYTKNGRYIYRVTSEQNYYTNYLGYKCICLLLSIDFGRTDANPFATNDCGQK